MRVSDSDSGSVTGLEIWRQMSIHFAAQRKLEPSHSSSRSCHQWSGMPRSQRTSFSSTITGWNSSQSMKRSIRTRSQTLSRSLSHFRMSRGTLLSPSTSVSVILQHGLRFMHSKSTASTMQSLLTSSPSISSIRPRRPRSTRSRKAKAKVKNQKVKKERDQKGLLHFRIPRESRKANERPSRKAKVSGQLGHGVKISRMPVGVKVKKVSKGQKAAKVNQPAQFVENQDIPQNSAGGIEIKKDGILKDLHNNKGSSGSSTPRKFTTFISTLRINQFRPYLQISSEVFEIYNLKLNNSNIRI